MRPSDSKLPFSLINFFGYFKKHFLIFQRNYVGDGQVLSEDLKVLASAAKNWLNWQNGRTDCDSHFAAISHNL